MYIKTNWVDEITPIDATNMNHIENGIESVDQALSGKANSSDLSSVATSGSYNDLTNKPTIPSVLNTQSSSTTDVYSAKYVEDNFGGGSTSDNIPIGVINAYGGSTAPNGYLLCDGSAVSRTTYADLFSVIGTTYGNGNGSTTFNIPNLKGKFLVGLDTSQSEFNVLGETGGEKTHKLTIQEMPSHNHELAINGGSSTGTRFTYTSDSQKRMYGGDDLIDKTGGGQAHNNLPPYIAINYIIKAL